MVITSVCQRWDDGTAEDLLLQFSGSSDCILRRIEGLSLSLSLSLNIVDLLMSLSVRVKAMIPRHIGSAIRSTSA